MPVTLLTNASKLEQSVGKAAYQMCYDFQLDPGRCKCGSILGLKFQWKQVPIHHPSLFWGCVSYTRNDAHRHKAKACLGTISDVLKNHVDKIATRDLSFLMGRFADAVQSWTTTTPTASQLEDAGSIYGKPETNQIPFASVAAFVSALKWFHRFVQQELKDRPCSTPEEPQHSDEEML